jgi:class 3 adenylate cyclase
VLTALALAGAAAAALVAWRAWRRTAVLARRLRQATHDLESLQQAFSRFAPHEVVERIIADGIATDAETKDVTILFADLKGFTALAERLDPARLVELLNGYFERMGAAVAAHRGHLAKFIGDGLLALFGALEPNPWQTNDALHAALAMRAALAEYNAGLRARGLPELAAGIGIHCGPVVAGVLGTSVVKEYGVIGRTVNVAARVEELTRVHGTDVLVTEAVRTRCDPRFRLRGMPAVDVKGLPEPVVAYALDGFDGA